jgi:ribonuclease P protein subunit POP4
MHINVKDFLRRELIGSTIKITNSKNKSLVGVKGKIIDETRNTLIIEENKKTKKIPKNQVTIEIKKTKIDGKLLVGRPEERLKQ